MKILLRSKSKAEKHGQFKFIFFIMGALVALLAIGSLLGYTMAPQEGKIQPPANVQQADSSPLPHGSAVPRIRVTPQKIDLGKIPSEMVRIPLTIHNEGEALLHIQAVTTNCPCTSVEGSVPQEPIPPGGTAQIAVIFDPNTHNTREEFIRTVYVRSDDPARPEVSVEIVGYVMPPQTFDSSQGKK
ncbi:MAG: DUF1573 domain-containing protein [Deltaproteobacteria bacterium]|nr:DUF1573 domain-containing protein [Deltaproteobacteria bacterium]